MNRFITIQDKKIQIKTEECICSLTPNSDRDRSITDQFVDITFIVGEKCNAKCKFCCGPSDRLDLIDIQKFQDFFLECLSKINVRKITFTGGEPTLPYYFNKIQKIGTWIKNISPNTCIIINTNGSNLKVIAYQKWIDKIALSRHHYKPSLNDSLFKCFTADDVDILMFGDKKKINLSCVCQKGYIDSGEELEKYLFYASLQGISEVNVYSLIPINDYAKSHFVDPNKFEFSKNIISYKSYEYPCKNVCKCTNYVYMNNYDNFQSVFFYIRNNINHKFNKGSYIVWKNNQIDFY